MKIVYLRLDLKVLKTINIVVLLFFVLILASCNLSNKEKNEIDIEVSMLVLGNEGENRIIEICYENYIDIYTEIETSKDSFEKIRYSINKDLYIISKETWEFNDNIQGYNTYDCYNKDFSTDTNKIILEDGSWLQSIDEYDPFDENKILINEYGLNGNLLNEYTYNDSPLLYDLLSDNKTRLEIIGGYLIIAKDTGTESSFLRVYEYDSLFNDEQPVEVYNQNIISGRILPLGDGMYIVYPYWWKDLMTTLPKDNVVYLDDSASVEYSRNKIFIISFDMK